MPPPSDICEKTKVKGRSMVVLYHRTSPQAARAILKEGFKDHTHSYLTGSLHTGVWFSDVPDAGAGEVGLTTLLKVTVSLEPSDTESYEWVDEGMHYREWLFPASLVNSRGSVEVVEE